MMRYAILIALLMCLPVRGEAWQVVGGAVAASGPFLSDTFTESNNTAITSHTPEVGGAWAYDTALGGSVMLVNQSGDYVKLTEATATFAYNSETPPSDDYTVTIECQTTAVSWTAAMGACARMTTTGGGYCARFEPNATTSKLAVIEKNSNAAFNDTKIGTDTVFTSANNTAYKLSLTVLGTSLTAQLRLNSDNSLVAEKVVTDDTYTDAGKAGFFIGTNVASYVTEIHAE